MGTNRSKPRIPIAERQQARKDKEHGRQQLDTLLQAAKIERMTQAGILEGLRKKHCGDIPAPVIWNFMADRRYETIAPMRGPVRIGDF